MRILISLLPLLCVIKAENILVVIPFTSTSHYKQLRPIGLELARRGHQVTVITAHREPNPPPNYTQVMADDIKIWEVAEGGRPNVFNMVDISFQEFTDIIFYKGGLFTTENVLKSKEVIEFMKEKKHFDLVISELFYQEALYMFSHKYNAPLVLMNTFGNCARANFMKRNPMQISTVLDEFARVENPRSFLGRLKNLYYVSYDLFWFYNWYMPKQELLVQKYFSNLTKPVPSLHELGKNSALVLMNSHFSIDVPTAYYPGFIENAGTHITEFDKPLPADLKEFIDEAEHGVVYVNFGSNIKSSELPTQKRDAFFNVFSKLKQRVVFKWEDKDVPYKLKNVLVKNWLPQKEILNHKNVKLFISHGGLIGFEEAVFNAVPIVGVPIYADQYNNLLRGKELGFVEILEFKEINENTLEDAIIEMLKPQYKENAVEVSQRFLDRPMSPMNESMYWIEYVIRHKGASFMRSPALEMYWFEYMMLDVLVFLALVVVVSLAVTYKIIRAIHSAILPSKKVKTQ